MTVLNCAFHDRIDACPALDAMGSLWGSAQRFLHAQHRKGRAWTGDLAKSHYRDFGLPAKQWEHCWRDLMGKVASQRECDLLETAKLERRIAAKRKTIAAAEKRLDKAAKVVADQLGRLRKAAEAERACRKPPRKAYDVAAHTAATKTVELTRFALHQHRRKLASLEHDLETSRTLRSLCFGGRKLFAEQHHLAENGHADHDAWKGKWASARNSQFFVEGDAGCKSGNGFVRLHPRLDGLFDVEWRLSDGLTHLAETCEKLKNGQIVHSVWFRGLRFTHGRTELYRALREGLPISWRFLRDEHHRNGTWRIMASVGLEYAEQPKRGESRWSLGSLGVDLNAGHVAATLVDRFGNPVETWNIPLLCYGKSAEQREDAVRKAVAELVVLAKRHGVPIVSELLDFAEKKSALRDTVGPARARALSSFAYAAFDRALASACVRNSIHLRRVNPAFTSVIGDLCFARRYGLSVHAAAAATIARRAMNLSERLPSPRLLLERRRHGDRVALVRPEWNGAGHVWSKWRLVAKERRAALAGPAGPWPPRPRPSDAGAGTPPPAAAARSGGE